VVRFRPQLQRIDIGIEMAADTVGADHHQGTDGIERCRADIRLAGGSGRAVFDFRLDFRLIGRRPIAVERADQFPVRMNRPVGPRPGRALGFLQHVRFIIAQGRKISPPIGIDRVRVFLVFGVKPFDETGVGSEEKGGPLKFVVRAVFAHQTAGAGGPHPPLCEDARRAGLMVKSVARRGLTSHLNSCGGASRGRC